MFEPGNKAAAKSKVFDQALRRVLAQTGGEQLRNIAEKLFEEAEKGEPWAISMLADRLDGKPHQSTEISNPDGSGIFSALERVIVDSQK